MPKRLRPRTVTSIASTCIHPRRDEVYRAAIAYIRSGLSLVPIAADGSKGPAVELLPIQYAPDGMKAERVWGIFRERPPTLDEVDRWFFAPDCECEYGLAIVGGRISGGLEAVDLDSYHLVTPFIQRVEDKAPGLWSRLVRVKTPRPGMHAYFRSDTCASGQKLAQRATTSAETGRSTVRTLIETKGEGGCIVAPPSPAMCHPNEVCYHFVDDRDLTQVPTITAREREILLEVARSFNEYSPPTKVARSRHRPSTANYSAARPGDDYNARADWAEILEPHGWEFVSDDGGGKELWRRPDKWEGVSATVNYGGSDLLYVWSSNADPFEERHAYSKFQAYALLEHDGDFSAAARELARLGYGEKGIALRSRVKSSDSEHPNVLLRSRRATPDR